MARDGGVRNQLLAVGVVLPFGAVVVGATPLRFPWMTDGFRSA